MPASSSLQLCILPAAQLAAQPAAWLRRVLGVASFGSAPSPALLALDLPLAPVRVLPLHGGADLCEIWLTDAPLRQGVHGRLRWRCNEDVLFGALSVPISATAPIPALQYAATQAYDEVFAALDTLGFSHLLRVWNHIPDINRESAGLEHYRQFNIGRQDAFMTHGRHLIGSSVPSASALGAASDAPLLVYFIAARQGAEGFTRAA